MSTIHGLSHKVIKHFRTEPSSLAVYWVYCSRVNNEGVAFPSLRGLVKDTGWSVNQIGDARKWLISVDALAPVGDYIRPAWRKLPKQEQTRRLNFDRSEYFRVTGHIVLDGVAYPLLYIPQSELSDIDDEESSDVSPRLTSAAVRHQPPSDVGRGETELDSIVFELDSSSLNLVEEEDGDAPEGKDSTPIPFHILNGLGMTDKERREAERQALLASIDAHPVWQAFARGWDGLTPDLSAGNAELVYDTLQGAQHRLDELGATVDDVEDFTRLKVNDPKRKSDVRLSFVLSDLNQYMARKRKNNPAQQPAGRSPRPQFDVKTAMARGDLPKTSTPIYRPRPMSETGKS